MLSSAVHTLVAAYHRHLGEDYGFMPRFRPVTTLPLVFQPFERAARELPDRLQPQHGGVRPWIERLFAGLGADLYLAAGELSPPAAQTWMLVLTLFGHAYRWDTIPPRLAEYERQTLILPPHLDRLWTEVAKRLGQLRVANLWTTNLCNWTLKRAGTADGYRLAELTSDNTLLLYNWLPSPYDRDAEAFMLTFTLVEVQGTRLLQDLVHCLQALADDDLPAAALALENGARHFYALHHQFSNELRKSTVRPPIWPTHIQPLFVWNVLTEQGRLGGTSGMNLGIFQTLNRFLGLPDRSALARATLAYRRYMPPHHRAFLEALDRVTPPALQRIALSSHRPLIEAFNHLVTLVAAWRRDHAHRGAVYLKGDAEAGEFLPQISTGGTLEPGNDRIGRFCRQMYERIEETAAAAIPTRPTRT